MEPMVEVLPEGACAGASAGCIFSELCKPPHCASIPAPKLRQRTEARMMATFLLLLLALLLLFLLAFALLDLVRWVEPVSRFGFLFCFDIHFLSSKRQTWAITPHKQ